MNCTDARELIVETLSGTTAPELRRAVEAHLSSCAVCRAQAASIEETARLLRAVPEAHLRDDHWDVIMARLDARLGAERSRPWNRVRRWFRQPRHAWTTAVATAAVVAAFAGALLSPALPPAESERGADAANTHVMEMVSPQVVEGMPAMNTSVTVWKAGLGTGDVSYELTGGR